MVSAQVMERAAVVGEKLNVRLPGQDEDMDEDQLDKYVTQGNEIVWKVARDLRCCPKCRNEERRTEGPRPTTKERYLGRNEVLEGEKKICER